MYPPGKYKMREAVFNGMFDYSNDDIKFTKEYVAWRGWEAEISIDNIHDDVFSWWTPAGVPKCPDDLAAWMKDLGTDNHHEAMNFWLELNCDGRWDRVGKRKIDFEFATDAMAYKIVWT